MCVILLVDSKKFRVLFLFFVCSYIPPPPPGWLVGKSAGLVIEGCEFESWPDRRENFFLQSQLCVPTLIWCPFHPVLPQLHVKDPGHSAKCAGGRLRLNRHTLLAQRSRSGLTMPLSRHSVGTYQQASSHATRQGTLGHRRLSSLNHCGLILAYRVELGCTS